MCSTKMSGILFGFCNLLKKRGRLLRGNNQQRIHLQREKDLDLALLNLDIILR